MSKKISFLDRTFWITESKDNPKHVASLQKLEMPEGAPEDYVEKLCGEMRSFDQAESPFNCKVDSFLGFPIRLKPVEKLDMQYHVQLHEVEDVDDALAIHELVARLHEEWLDRDKPLWQNHFIKDSKVTNLRFT